MLIYILIPQRKKVYLLRKLLKNIEYTSQDNGLILSK